MTEMRKLITLTLIGMMAAFVLPVCVNAQVGAPEPVPVEDTYNKMPTLTWASESGPTKFNLVINDEEPIAVNAGTLEEGKWVADSRTCGDVEGVTICTHSYTPSADLAPGPVTWTVAGERVAEDTSPEDDTDYTTDPSAASSFTIFGAIQLTIATDVAEADPEGTVTATVSLDNIANGSIPLNSLKFDVEFNDAAFTAPEQVVLKGAVSSIEPTLTPAPGKLSFEFVGEIQAGTGAIVDIPFTVKADAAPAADYTFKLSGNETMSNDTPYEDPENPGAVAPNPSSPGDPVTVAVAASVLPGDLNNDGTVDLVDMILSLQVALGMDVTVELGADVNKDDKIDTVESVFVLKDLSTP